MPEMDVSPNLIRGSSLSEKIAAVAGWLCFALVCIFYGADVNLIIFLFAVLALLAGLSVVVLPLAAQVIATPRVFGVVALALAGLLISYQFSLSRDSSFVATWVVALTPLTFLLARGMGGSVARLQLAITITVLMFAALSLWQLLASGTRASLPLTDPNNYGALLYLILLPWMHRYFLSSSRTNGPRLGSHFFQQGVFFVLLCALMATQSRVSMLVVALALGIWGGLCVARRLRWRPVLVSGVLALGAYFFVVSVSGTFGEPARSFDLGTGLVARGALIRSAMAMYGDHALTGIGIFVFPLMYRQLRETADQTTAGLLVHNDYVQVLVEAGPVLLLALTLFAGAVLIRFTRSVRAASDSDAFAGLGWVMALGAALAHAMVNFVLFSPALAVVLGILAARVFPASAVGFEPPAAAESQLRASRTLLVVGLLVGWVAWLYLLLDTAIAGVLQNQPRIPFAAAVREDPDRMLRFSRLAQSLNANRGVPVLAEAALLEQRLDQDPSSEYLRERTVAAYRRAMAADPWNPLALLMFYELQGKHPDLTPGLTDAEKPETLLLTTVSIDPLFVPGIDRLLNHLAGQGRREAAYQFLRRRVYPWLPLLARLDKPSALRYLGALRAMAGQRNEREFVAELDALEMDLSTIEPIKQVRGFF